MARVDTTERAQRPAAAGQRKPAAELAATSPNIEDPWMAAMCAGDYTRAWQISDEMLRRRIARGDPVHVGPRHLQRIWTGEPLAGKRVLVRCYHGLGDTMQFIRFAAPLRRIAREVIVWAQEPLLALISTASGVDRVLPLHDGTPDVDFEADIEIMELAHALRVDERSIACPVPYLFPEEKKGPSLRSPSGFSVGVVWRAGDWDERRSLRAESLSPLSFVSGVRLLSLQVGTSTDEAKRIPARDVSSPDVDDLTAILQQLDLLISVDTFAAHLAGALGIPTWLLLHTECDWRWTRHRSHSVWYPTMRLFRQRRAGDWPTVIDEVAAELRALVDARARTNRVPGTNACI